MQGVKSVIFQRLWKIEIEIGFGNLKMQDESLKAICAESFKLEELDLSHCKYE